MEYVLAWDQADKFQNKALILSNYYLGSNKVKKETLGCVDNLPYIIN